MSTEIPTPTRRLTRLLSLLGLLLVAASMFLPAVQLRQDPSDHFISVFKGYDCAKMFFLAIDSLLRWAAHPAYSPGAGVDFLVGFPGIINPLLLLFPFAQRRGRTAVLTLVALALATTLACLVSLHLLPRPGFYLWLVGIATVLAPTLLPRQTGITSEPIRRKHQPSPPTR